MSAKERERTDADQLTRTLAQNQARVEEVRGHIAELENLFCAIKLWPEKFPASLLLDAIDDTHAKSEEEVTPLIITGGQIQEVKVPETESGPRSRSLLARSSPSLAQISEKRLQGRAPY